MAKLYKAEVQRSAKLLDEKKPGWWDGGKRKKINLKTLDLEDCAKCVLGQLWGTKGGVDGFSRAMNELDLWTDDSYAFVDLLSKGYARLTRRWVEEIERRRA